MSDQDGKALVRRYFEEIRNQRKRDVSSQIFADDVAVHVDTLQGPETYRGARAIHEALETYLAVFPDLRFTVEDELAEADRVMTRWRAQGTHRGDLMGHAATGRTVTFGGIDVYRIANGKIAEGWTSYDRLVILQQVGGAPTPRQGGG